MSTTTATIATSPAAWVPTRDEVAAIVREMRPIIDRCCAHDAALLQLASN